MSQISRGSDIQDNLTNNTDRFEIEERGEVQFRDGSTYKGQWKGDYKWGYGIQTWPDGSSYAGEWERDI